MPFNSSYKDHDKIRYLSARECFQNLANIIIKDPLSTQLFKMHVKSDKVCYLVVDRAQVPRKGDIALMCTPHGLHVERIKRPVPREDLWGKVIWYVQEG